MEWRQHKKMQTNKRRDENAGAAGVNSAVKLWMSTKKLFISVILTRSFLEIIVYSTRRNVILNSLMVARSLAST